MSILLQGVPGKGRMEPDDKRFLGKEASVEEQG